MSNRYDEVFNRLRSRIRQLGMETYWKLYHDEVRGQRKPPAARIERPGRRAARNVVFLNNSYYNFLYLARALRDRGWDAISVNLTDPEGPQRLHYHGADVNLFSANPIVYRKGLNRFAEKLVDRFDMVHFYGAGNLSLFPELQHRDDRGPDLPWDFSWFRSSGIKIGYSVNGCSDGIAQTHLHRWTGGLCDRCVWQNRPEICSDEVNLSWGRRVIVACDLICSETHPAIDFQVGEKVYREPLTTALDPEVWSSNLEIPSDYRIDRKDDECLIYHGVGNYDTRTTEGRNVKGTDAILAAVERLRAEGQNVRLLFASDIHNLELRFLQVQSDIIVDQLGIGRYGATAREGMMLGKPVVCRLVAGEERGVMPLKSLLECPVVSATEGNIYEVLRDLVRDKEMRTRIGEASRRFMLKWYSADACAARYEEVYDRLMSGRFVECPAAQKSSISVDAPA